MPDVWVQGHRLSYREEGRGRAVLLLHGVAGASGFWAGTMSGLAPGFRKIAPDLLGFGDSEKPRQAYSISGHAALAREFTAALGLHEFDVIGHSMGGMIALLLSILCPEKTGKLVLINTPVSGGRALHGRGRVGALAPGLALVKIGLHIPWVLWALRRIPRYYYVLDPRFTSDARKAPFYSLTGNARAIRQTDLGSRLREVSVPTLVIGTHGDGIVRPSEFSLAAAEIPGARLFWVQGAGHCPTLERPEETHKAINDFLMSGKTGVKGPRGPGVE